MAGPRRGMTKPRNRPDSDRRKKRIGVTKTKAMEIVRELKNQNYPEARIKRLPDGSYVGVFNDDDGSVRQIADIALLGVGLTTALVLAGVVGSTAANL